MLNKRNMRTVFMVALLLLVPMLVYADEVTVTLKAGSYQIVKNQKNEDVIQMVGFGLSASSGNPMLPVRVYNIALPPDVDWATMRLRVDRIEAETLSGSYSIPPAPPLATWDPDTEQVIVEWGENKQIVDGKNILVYQNAAPYPENIIELLPYGQMRKWKFSRVQFYPLRYNPVSGELRLIKEAVITLTFQRRGVQGEQDLLLLADTVMDDQARALLYNYPEASEWYQAPEGVARPSVTYDYVIITSSTIKTNSTKLNTFKAHKQSLGFSVLIIDETTFGGAYDIQKDIRTWLNNNYISYGIKYVFLVGDPWELSTDIPMRLCWPRFSATEDREAPTDYYYADLSGDWDLDNDGYYGEHPDDTVSGGVDLFPEVYVGRIPVWNSDVVPLDSILQKMINYENTTGSRVWRKRILLPMKPSDGSTPGYQLGEYIKNDFSIPAGDSYYRIYESTYGLVPPPEKTPCNKTNVVNEWKKGYGMVWWWTHGSETSAADVFDITLVPQLNDNRPAFTYQCSCLNAHPSWTNNLAYELLEHGAVNTVGATRVSWYFGGWTSPTIYSDNASIGYYYIRKLRALNTTSSEALYHTKMSQLWGGSNALLMNMYDFNIYGDPSMRISPLKALDVAAGQGPGAASYTRDFNALNGNKLNTWRAFGAGNVNGEVSVAKGDVTGDGIPEIVVGQRSTGASSYVRVFMEDGALAWTFKAFGGGNTNGMVNVAVGDVDGDGVCEIVVGQGPGGQSYVRIFEYKNPTPVTTWKAFGGGNTSGEVRVAAGRTDEINRQIITGQGHGGQSYVRVWHYGTPPFLSATIKAFGGGNTSGGVDVAVGRCYQALPNGRDFIVVGQGGPGETTAAPAGSYVRIFYLGVFPPYQLVRTIKAFGPGNANGRVTVSAGQADDDLVDEIIVGQAVGGNSYWRVFDYCDGSLIRTVKAFGGGNISGQVDVAGARHGEGCWIEGFDDGVADNWIDDGSGAWSVTGGDYVMSESSTSGVWRWSFYDKVYTDFVFPVSIKRVTGSQNAPHSVMFRGTDADNCYRFDINNNGYFRFAVVQGSPYGTYVKLLQSWTFIPHLHTGLDVWNYLDVYTDGPKIWLFANGHLLGTYTDHTYSTGKVGVGCYVADIPHEVHIGSAELYNYTLGPGIAGCQPAPTEKDGKKVVHGGIEKKK